MREGTEYCWRKAADCAARAGRASDDETRKFFIRLRDLWICVANRHGLVAWLDVGGKRRNPRRRTRGRHSEPRRPVQAQTPGRLEIPAALSHAADRRRLRRCCDDRVGTDRYWDVVNSAANGGGAPFTLQACRSRGAGRRCLSARPRRVAASIQVRAICRKMSRSLSVRALRAQPMHSSAYSRSSFGDDTTSPT